jgi:hypothetical protein
MFSLFQKLCLAVFYDNLAFLTSKFKIRKFVNSQNLSADIGRFVA